MFDTGGWESIGEASETTSTLRVKGVVGYHARRISRPQDEPFAETMHDSDGLYPCQRSRVLSHRFALQLGRLLTGSK